MIKLFLNNRKISTIVEDYNLLNSFLLEEMSKVMPNRENVSKVFQNELYEVLLKVLLVKELDTLKLEDNKAYNLNIVIGDNKYIFVVAKYNNEKVDKGYDINKTLLV